ncbi:MAG: hypothetical protein ACYSWO_06435 [Planctomycetota bacterium]|jgi:hypothetical protein
MEIDYFPNEVLEFATSEEMEWIKALYDSPKITTIREKYIEIDDQLENLPRGEKRTKLCHELFKIRAFDFSSIDLSEIGSDRVQATPLTEFKRFNYLGIFNFKSIFE